MPPLAAQRQPRQPSHRAHHNHDSQFAPGNPKKIYDLTDLTRRDVKFINRASDSGTRFLLEGLLNERQIAETDIHGFEQSEATHAGVAAYVASELADAGFGLERPA